MMKSNYFSIRKLAGVFLLVTAILLTALLPGCSDTNVDPNVDPNGTPTEFADCTIEVKSVGGKALEGVGMYIYKDAAMTEMLDYVKTDAQGIAAVTRPVPAGSIAVLDKVPVGYVAEQS